MIPFRAEYMPQPLRVCQQLYGVQNVNNVRDAVMSSFRRFLGYEADWTHPQIYQFIQSTLIQILVDAGRNPRAVRLAMPPERITANPFPTYFIQTGGDKQAAYEMAVREVLDTYPTDQVREALTHIYIDYHSV